nr:hypothetical protein [Isoptericola sp. BMS4]
MPALAVVEDLEVLDDRVGKFQTGAPPATVQELGLHARPEALDQLELIGSGRFSV